MSKRKQKEKPIEYRALTEDERAKILARIRAERMARLERVRSLGQSMLDQYPVEQGLPQTKEVWTKASRTKEVWTKASRETMAQVKKRTEELSALAKAMAEQDVALRRRRTIPKPLEIPVQAYDAMRIFFTNKSWAITRAEVKSMMGVGGNVECDLELRLIQVEPGAPRILVRDAEMLIEILEAILDVSTDRVRVAREPRRKAPAARTRRRLSRGDRV